jgi:hypothetical protein
MNEGTSHVLCDDLNGGGGGEEKKDEDKCEPEPVPRFAEMHAAFQTVKSFSYLYNTGNHNENILNMERKAIIHYFNFLLFSHVFDTFNAFHNHHFSVFIYFFPSPFTSDGHRFCSKPNFS